MHAYPSGVDVRPKFHWGFSYVVICSGYISDCFRVCLGLVWIFFKVYLVNFRTIFGCSRVCSRLF